MYTIRYSEPGSTETKEVKVNDDFCINRDDCDFATPPLDFEPENGEWDELSMRDHSIVYDKRGLCIVVGRVTQDASSPRHE